MSAQAGAGVIFMLAGASPGSARWSAALKEAFAVAADRPVALDGDTHINDASEEAAYRAAGAGIGAIIGQSAQNNRDSNNYYRH